MCGSDGNAHAIVHNSIDDDGSGRANARMRLKSRLLSYAHTQKTGTALSAVPVFFFSCRDIKL